jgi:hypothetical protein
MAYTYSDLKTDIRNYTEVDSNVLSDSILTSLVKKAENKVYRAVDTDEEREYATSVLATGNRYVTIPTDLRAIRYVQLADNSTSPAKQVYLEKRDTSFMAEYYNTPSNSSGFPKYYANWDEQFWVVAPTPDQQYAITLAYTKQPTSITTSDSQTTEVYGYLKGPADMLNFYQQSYTQALESYALEQQGLRRRDEYMDGVIRVPMKSKPPSI